MTVALHLRPRPEFSFQSDAERPERADRYEYPSGRFANGNEWKWIAMPGGSARHGGRGRGCDVCWKKRRKAAALVKPFRLNVT